jgi:branched-chain amino acid transport system permease protein
MSNLENRREKARKLRNGYRTTLPVFAIGALACLTLLVLPIGRSRLSVGLVAAFTTASLVCAAAGTLFETSSKLGKLLRLLLLITPAAFLCLIPLNRANSTLIDLGLFVIFGIAVIGLNLIQGFAGQVSLAHAAFMGLGAYSSSLLNNGAEIAWGPLKAKLPNLPFLATIPVAMALCFFFSVLIGFPALRVQGPWLAFVTVAFNGLVVLVMNNETALTGGPQGTRADRTNLNIFGISMFDTRNYYYFCLGVLGAVVLFVWWMIRSPWGRAFTAIRDNANRASSVGVSVPTYKLLAFAIGSMLAGLAGALYAPLIEFIEPGSFTVLKSFSFLLATVVGGVGTLVGPLLGTIFIVFPEKVLRYVGGDESKLGENYQLFFAAFVVFMMLVAPKGLVGLSRRIRLWVVARGKEKP